MSQYDPTYSPAPADGTSRLDTAGDIQVWYHNGWYSRECLPAGASLLAASDAPSGDHSSPTSLCAGAALPLNAIDYQGRLRKGEWEVRPVSISVARELVEKYHYARGASNTRTYLHGLFRTGAFWESDCLGVAWWIPPTRGAAEATYPENWQGVLALSRLVVAPGVPKNACTFLLSRSVKLIPAKEWPCLVTYADDWRGHTGTIYRASNWDYAGKTGAEETYTIDGVMTARKAGGRTRTRAEMVALGARCEGRHQKHKYVLNRASSKK
jgi:hypothetical protein